MKVSKKFNRLERITVTLSEVDIEVACLKYAQDAGGAPKGHPSEAGVRDMGDDMNNEYEFRMVWVFEKEDVDEDTPSER